MKKFLGILIMAICVAFVSSAQDLTKTHTMSRTEANNDYSYYSFPISTTTDYIAGSNDSLIYEININKHFPAEVQWFIAIDTMAVGGNDSLNINIDLDFKVFGDESYTTLKTIAYDGDANGDYSAAVRDSSHMGAEIIPLSAPVFARQSRLTLFPTTGAGVGSVGDSAQVQSVIVKIHVLK